ncbi:hypothetical protein [Gordoniibacillus kamchatkensis]|uniref:hypothetical protein n=1 Tax=Gordoniibacillus kamchatkensis TaxID=1590651 RepID=UPI0006978B6B|nr:hypothetical protein [Paenibacillus sp. VKM B-2647]
MNAQRIVSAVLIGVLIVVIITAVASSFGSKDKGKNAAMPPGGSSGTKSVQASQTAKQGEASKVVPWDYKVEQKKVGDLINGDMSLQPDNELVPNDDNYATGDSVWVLSVMNAVMTTQADGKNDVTLTAWKPIKTFRQQDAAGADLGKLKETVQTDVELVGVYKTELDGKYREFAVITLPSGQNVKQPIDEARYNDFKTKKQVKASLEIVHDFNDYDKAYPKFRGWAS